MTTPLPTAVVVHDRTRTRRLDWLDMRCSEKEIPNFVQNYAADYWLIGTAGFIGTAGLLTEDGQGSGTTRRTGAQGTAAVGIDKGRLIAIVSPNSATEPAVWINARLGELSVTTAGSQGLLKKRPEQITVALAEQWELVLGEVSRLYRQSGRFQTGQEVSLLKALG